MALSPLSDRVLIRRSIAATQLPSGIYVPPVASEKPVEGEVIAVGPGRRTHSGDLIPVTVAVGDTVLFGKYTGTEVLGDEGLLLLREDEILAIISKD